MRTKVTVGGQLFDLPFGSYQNYVIDAKGKSVAVAFSPNLAIALTALLNFTYPMNLKGKYIETDV